MGTNVLFQKRQETLPVLHRSQIPASPARQVSLPVLGANFPEDRGRSTGENTVRQDLVVVVRHLGIFVERMEGDPDPAEALGQIVTSQALEETDSGRIPSAWLLAL